MIDLMRQVLRVFERHQLWKEGVELIGSWCFYFYQRHFGVKPYPLKTQDIDFLLPYPYRGKVKVDFVKELKELGFQADFRPDGALYLRSAEFRVGFIVPERGRGMEEAASIPPLGLYAVPLRFMDILLSHPISIVDEGITISVPEPAAFCFHKLLIAVRRRRGEKRIKDFEQALHVSSALKKQQLQRMYGEFPKGWQKRIIQSLEQAVRDVPLLEDEANQLKATLQSLK